MKRSKPVTIKDIAAVTGYSVTTVSRVLSQIDYPVRKQVRESILESAKKLDYTPNLLARGLKTSRSNEIAAVVRSFTNPFNISLLSGIENVSIRQDYNILFYNTKNRFIDEQKITESILSKRIEGLILASVYKNPSIVNSFLSNNIKVVLIDHRFPGVNCSSVYFNYKKGLIMETEYLIKKGHRRIVYLDIKPDTPSRIDRLQGFKEAFRKTGIQYFDEYVFKYEDTDPDNENPDFKAGIELAEKALQSDIKPTAIIADNDITALGVLNYLNRSNITVPQDISVVGYDDSIFSGMTFPPLTTVRVPATEMGEKAVEILLEDIRENRCSNLQVVMEPELIERESVSHPSSAEKHPARVLKKHALNMT